jgi:phenylacetate-CoA ligase
MSSQHDADPADVIRRMYDSLLESQHAPPATLVAHQQQTLRHLVDHAIGQTDFYRERFSDLATGSGPIDPVAWSSIEPVDREVIATRYDDLVARSIPTNHGQVGVKVTSGSSGGPVRVMRTAMTGIADSAAVFRLFTTHGIKCSQPLAQIRVFRTDVRRLEPSQDLGSWGPPWLEKSQRGPVHRLSVFTPAGEQLRWLRDIQGAYYLNTLPSNLSRLTKLLRQQNTRVENVATVISVGEPVTEELRQACRDWLNAEIVDFFSSAECGVVATQCPAGAGFHVQSEICLAEVLRPNGQACEIGETGDLVVTPFYNFAMPLIRYRTGDIATVGAQCPCGRTLPVLDGPITRAANQIDVGSHRRWTVPAGFADRLEQYLGPCPWQLVQEAPAEISLRFCKPAGIGDVDAFGAARYLGSLLPSDLTVRCTEVDIVGRGAGGKFANVISLTG